MEPLDFVAKLWWQLFPQVFGRLDSMRNVVKKCDKLWRRWIPLLPALGYQERQIRVAIQRMADLSNAKVDVGAVIWPSNMVCSVRVEVEQCFDVLES